MQNNVSKIENEAAFKRALFDTNITGKTAIVVTNVKF